MLILALVILTAAPESPSCVVFGEKKAAVAGLLQVEVAPDAAVPKTFDGHAAAFWLADDRARVCSAHGTLKLLDKLLSSYSLVLEPRSECLLLVDLGAKRAVLHDSSGSCAKELCGGALQLDGVKLTRDKAKKPCRATRR